MKTIQHLILPVILVISTLPVAQANTGGPACSEAPSKTEMFCSVTNFVMTPTSCDGELREFSFTFTGTDFGLNGYTIHSPDGNRMYTLGSPQVYSMIALCNETVVFTIFDNDNPSCNATFSYGLVCCPCQVDINVNQGPCDNGATSATFSIPVMGGSCGNYAFQLFINNVPYPLRYDRTTNLFRTDPIRSTAKFLTYRICTNVPNLNECYEYVFPNPCYEVITNFRATLNPASCSDGHMVVPFSFIGDEFGLQGFTVYSNIGTTHSFVLGDDYELILPANCDVPVILTIVDNAIPSNYALFTLGKVCCPCQPKFKVHTTYCAADTFSLNIVFKNQAEECDIDTWTLKVNGQSYHLFKTDTGYISSQIVSADSLVKYKLCGLLSGKLVCFNDTLKNPCFGIHADTCKITGFSVTADANSCSGGFIDLRVDYKAIGFGADGFILSTNTGYNQRYSVADSLILKLPADCDQKVIVTLSDVNNALCTAVDSIGILCCSCKPSFTVFTTTCVQDSFNLHIIVDNLSGSCVNYDWSLLLNGQEYKLIRTDTEYIASGIQSNDSLLVMELCTLVPGLSECFFDTLANPCYVVTSGKCKISGLHVRADASTCAGANINLNFDYAASSFGLNGYTIHTNTGYSQPFGIGDPAFFILLADCNENIIVTITDAVDSLCNAVDTIGVLCCSCVPAFTVTTGNCVQDNFNLNIDINSISGSCIHYNWTLLVNGQAYLLNQTDTGYEVNGVQSADSLMIYELCALLPELSECFTLTTPNPCFDNTVSIVKTELNELVQLISADGQDLKIISKYDQSLKMQLYNISGQQIIYMPALLPHGSTSIDISSLPSGLYIVRISANDKTTSKKLVIAR